MEDLIESSLSPDSELSNVAFKSWGRIRRDKANMDSAWFRSTPIVAWALWGYTICFEDDVVLLGDHSYMMPALFTQLVSSCDRRDTSELWLERELRWTLPHP